MRYSDLELEAFLDEALSVEGMAAIEQQLRADEELRQRLTQLHARRDAGIHSLGEIWRRHRLSCATREQLGSYLLGTIDKPLREFLDLHLAGCRVCQANLADLQFQQAEEPTQVSTRRKRYFQSSAGHLPR